VTSVNPVGSQYTQQYQPTTYNPNMNTTGYNASPYTGDRYSAGYVQGANTMAGPANGMSGLAGGLSSVTSSMGGIFGAILDTIAGILNTVVNIVVNLVEGVLGLFGIGKKDKAQQGGAMQDGMPNNIPNTNSQVGATITPAGTQVPSPPPGTDVSTAYSIVAGDAQIQQVKDPNEGIVIINIHAQKAKDYRDKVEQFSKEAEKEARQALYLCQSISKSTTPDQAKVVEMNQHKSKAMELLNTAQEYTKAVYDESLYAQAANDIINSKFGGALGNKGTEAVSKAWQNWMGGYTEREYLIMTKDVKAAPDVFMQSMNAVNTSLGQATQILNSMSVRN